jgi:excisionase family DNA binding protein
MMQSNALAAEGLAMVVLPKSAWEAVALELKEIKNLFQKKSEEEVSNQWIESTEVRRMLGISAKTWQTYRDERRIPFSQFGRKIYVKRADLEAFMEEHYINSRK